MLGMILTGEGGYHFYSLFGRSFSHYSLILLFYLILCIFYVLAHSFHLLSDSLHQLDSPLSVKGDGSAIRVKNYTHLPRQSIVVTHLAMTQSSESKL